MRLGFYRPLFRPSIAVQAKRYLANNVKCNEKVKNAKHAYIKLCKLLFLQNVKLLSALWCASHFLIVIALIAAFSVVLSTRYWEYKDSKDKDKDFNFSNNYKYNGFKHFYPKTVAFSVVLGVNCIVLIVLMILVCATWKKSDYDDYTVDFKNDDQQHVVQSH